MDDKNLCSRNIRSFAIGLDGVFFSPLQDEKKINVDQTEIICRRQFECYLKHNICLLEGRKLCGRKEKMLDTSIFSFPAMFSKCFLLGRGHQKSSMYGKGFTYSAFYGLTRVISMAVGV